LWDMARWLGAASQHAARPQATAEGSMEGSAAAANKLRRKLTNGWHDKSASRFSLFPPAQR